MTTRGMVGSPQTASATARARAGLDTVVPAGKAKCRWFCGRALTRLTTRRVTASGWAHRTALAAVAVLPGLAGLVLAGWVALDVVAAWLPQAATSAVVPAAARTSSPGRVRRVRRPGWVPGTPMVFSVPWPVNGPENQCVQGTERRPGPLSEIGRASCRERA